MNIKDYKESASKPNYDFSKNIKRKYMPFAEKQIFVETIVKKSCYTEVEGRKVYRRNTSSMLFLFTMQMVEKYTNLEYAADEVVQAYDELMSSGLMRPLLKQIPESETMILREMLDAYRDDEEANTRSLVSFLETKADAVQLAIDGLISVLSQPDLQDKLSQITQ